MHGLFKGAMAVPYSPKATRQVKFMPFYMVIWYAFSLLIWEFITFKLRVMLKQF